ncbi:MULTISPECIES: phage tail protein [unclassified Burkholderia]|uniref:phage tail protein n=1 Tax=unclassified Burkholderia TaxID=2613784 RepID=UPI00142475A9|nr:MULTISPECIES: phage tail protein [unclassified Burkholderia]NIE58652.1 phage tail protein [Burkholderia sp. Ap-955]NIF10147.1 phage tail protein [Burkholderia sp. Ax-1735]NIG03598.1 phage tail protein [Burkholderia sp. Tr-849]
MANTRVDPFKGFRFRVEIDGIQQAGFSECSGLGSHVEVIEYREGGDTEVHKLPGKPSVPDITLKWGATNSRELYDWHRTAVVGQIQRRNGTITLCDDTGQPQVQWHFFGGWASKWDGPSFNAKGNDVAIETLTISCERLERG